MFYQTLAGAWPAELVPEAALSDGGRHLEALRLRLLDFMEKMGREAKLRTTWTSPDAAYDEAIARFVSAVLSPPTGAAFLGDFVRSCRPLWPAGAINGLSHRALHPFPPGFPPISPG